MKMKGSRLRTSQSLQIVGWLEVVVDDRQSMMNVLALRLRVVVKANSVLVLSCEL